MEFQTDEDNNGVNETLYSELDIDLNGMAAGESADAPALLLARLQRREPAR